VTDGVDNVEQQLLDCRAQCERLTAFLRVSRLMNAETNRARLIEKINEEVRSDLDADRFTVFFHDTDTDELYSFVATGVHRGEIRIPSDQGVAGHVFQSGEMMCVADAYEDPRFNPDVDRRTGYRTKSLLSLPITTSRGGTRIGVVQALNKNDGGEFSDDDVQFLKDLIEQISDLLDLMLRKEELARKHAVMQEAVSQLGLYEYLVGEKTITKLTVRWSRKFHIWLSIIAAIFILIMSVSGIIVEHVEHPIVHAIWYNIHTGDIALRLWGWVYSDILGVLLVISTVTGIVLWLYPLLSKWARRRIERQAK
jgi:putative methionine-R-sulfoxide reductase with GAF domain